VSRARGVANTGFGDEADSENDLGGSYVLHRTGHSQKDDQLLHEGRERSDPSGRQNRIDALRTGQLDQDTSPTPHALLWSGIWIGLALLFNLGTYHWYGHELALQFLAGYLIEKSLSVDNLFVFVMIFSWFSVPKEHQHRILFWGVMGAFIMRGLFIAAGTALIQRIQWIIYIFGVLLLYTAWKMLQSAGQKFDGDTYTSRQAGCCPACFLLLLPAQLRTTLITTRSFRLHGNGPECFSPSLSPDAQCAT
jgi:hypothetical protein